MGSLDVSFNSIIDTPGRTPWWFHGCSQVFLNQVLKARASWICDKQRACVQRVALERSSAEQDQLQQLHPLAATHPQIWAKAAEKSSVNKVQRSTKGA